MSHQDALLAACVRYADGCERYTTAQEVILALDDAARPAMRAYGIWRVPFKTLRGNRDPYPTQIHPDVQPFVDAFWPKYRANGPSVVARYAWRTHRDFSLRDVLRTEKPKPPDLWIFELLHKHGIGDLRYIAVFRYWYAVYWSPQKSVRLTKVQWRALRLAAEAAVERIEQLVDGHENLDPGLTGRERDVLRLLRSDATVSQVAQSLKISLPSVKSYVARARGKLGTDGLRDTIAEAVRRYVVLGIIYAGVAAQVWGTFDVHCWD